MKQDTEIEELIEELNLELNTQHQEIGPSITFNYLLVAALLDRYLTKGFEITGLKRTQIMILSYLLSAGGSLVSKELRSKLIRSNNAISKSLDGLDKLGLTKSTGSKIDRRIRKVTITKKGLKQLKTILTIRREIFAKATQNLNKKDAEALNSILPKMEMYLRELASNKKNINQEQRYF